MSLESKKIQLIDFIEGDDSYFNYYIQMFGITESGESVGVKVKKFRPYFYIKCPNNSWTESHIDDLKLDLKEKLIELGESSRSGKPWGFLVDKMDFEFVKKISFDGYLPKNPERKFIKISFESNFGFSQTKRLFSKKGFKVLKGSLFKLYEADIPPFLRLFHDNDTRPAGWIELTNHRDALVKTTRCKYEYDIDFEDIKPIDKDDIGPIHIGSFDLECTSGDGSFPQYDRKEDKIIQIGTTFHKYGKNYRKNIIYTLKGCSPVPNAEVKSFKTEKELIAAWADMIIREDPDILTGYNILGFDYEYIVKRAELIDKTKKLKSKVIKISRLTDETTNNYILSRRYVQKELQSSALGKNFLKYIKMPGRINIDMMKYVQREYKLELYNLNYVAQHFLKNMKKEDMPYDELFRLHKEGTDDDRARIASYCIQDCWLCNELIKKLCVIENSIGMANTCLVPIDYIFMRGQGIKALSLVAKETKEFGYLLPTLSEKRPGTYKGAIVLDAKAGYHFYPVSCLDYASLYPSCMISHNLCISSLVTHPKLKEKLEKLYDNGNGKYVEKDPRKKDIFIVERYANGDEKRRYRVIEWDNDPEDEIRHERYFYYQPPGTGKDINDKERGLFPQILQKLLDKRSKTKKKMKAETDKFKKSIWNGLQLSYKITANSIYGQLGSPTSAFSMPCVAASVTAVGRSLLEIARDECHKKYNTEAIYGDSVTGDTPILLRNDKGEIEIKTIETISNEWVSYEEFKPFDTNRKEKQQTKTNYKVWTRSGWSNIKRVIRHKTTKNIYRILTHTGVVDVSEDHSLLNSNNEIIKPGDCKIKETLLLQSYPENKDKNPKHLNDLVCKIYDEEDNLTLEEKEAFIYGIFYGDGSCGRYNTKWGIKHTWAINNQDERLLNKSKKYLEELYKDNKTVFGNQYKENSNTRKMEGFKILETMKSSGVKKLVPKGSIKSMVDIFRPILYDKDKFKIVPHKILNGSYQQRLYFLIGYYAADGYKCINQKSKNIILTNKGKIGSAHLYYLMHSLGYKTSLNIRNDKPLVYQLGSTLGKFRKPENQIKKIVHLRTAKENEFIYDLETEDGSFQAGIGNIIVKNTDSVFLRFPLPEGVDPMSQEALAYSIDKAREADAYVTENFLYHPHELEYEKTYQPFILFIKKRYVGKLYEFNTGKNDWKLDYKGIELKRRDNANITKKIYRGCLDLILEGKVEESFRYLATTLKEIYHNHKLQKFKITDFMLTQNLKPVESYKTRCINADCKIQTYYGKGKCDNCMAKLIFPNKPHVMLAERVRQRDPGNAFQSNDRVPYVFIKPTKEYIEKYKIDDPSLQGNRVETPSYLEENPNISIDYGEYLEQIENPILQLYGRQKGKTKKITNENFMKLPKEIQDNILKVQEIFNDMKLKIKNERAGNQPINKFFKKSTSKRSTKKATKSKPKDSLKPSAEERKKEKLAKRKPKKPVKSLTKDSKKLKISDDTKKITVTRKSCVVKGCRKRKDLDVSGLCPIHKNTANVTFKS